MQKNEINFKNLPEKYQQVFEDKNKNGKPDFFENSTLEIIKKFYNLFTQKDPQIYGYKKINPSTLQIVLFILIVMAIAVFAVQLLPIIIFFGVAYFTNKKKSVSIFSEKSKTEKPKNKINIQTKIKQHQAKYKIPTPETNLTNNFQDSFSNGIRIALLIGVIAYCFYLTWPYLQNHFS